MEAAAGRNSHMSAWNRRRMKCGRLFVSTLLLLGQTNTRITATTRQTTPQMARGMPRSFIPNSLPIRGQLVQATFPPKIPTNVLLSPFNGRASPGLSEQVRITLTLEFSGRRERSAGTKG